MHGNRHDSAIWMVEVKATAELIILHESKPYQDPDYLRASNGTRRLIPYVSMDSKMTNFVGGTARFFASR